MKFMPKAMTDYDWMKKQLNYITELGKKLEQNGETNVYGAYTALKLISVSYYATIFAGVARHQNRINDGFDGAVYVDLFAGAGLVKIKDTGDYVAGSVPCAMLNRNGFDYCVAVEKDQKKAESLQTRLNNVLDNDSFTIVNDDCNSSIDKVVNSIRERYEKPIVFTFVDPEGMEIDWDTLLTLNNEFFSCDFMVNFSPSSSLRVAGKLKKGIDEVSGILSRYWGESSKKILSEFDGGKKPEEKYRDKMHSIGKTVGRNIPIRDVGKNMIYYLLGYTRMTSGGSGYADGAFGTLSRRFKPMNRQAIVSMLNQIHGRDTSLF